MEENHQYKVIWLFKGSKKACRGDYFAPNLKEVLRMINKSEGVSTTSTDYIYIHHIMPDGSVCEVFCHDHKKGEENIPADSNVVSIVDKLLEKQKEESKTKPHIKLSHVKEDNTLVRRFVTASFGRYKAYEAT